MHSGVDRGVDEKVNKGNCVDFVQLDQSSV